MIYILEQGIEYAMSFVVVKFVNKKIYYFHKRELVNILIEERCLIKINAVMKEK